MKKPVRILKVGRRYQYEPRPPSLPKLKKYHLVYLSKRIFTKRVQLKILYASRMLAGDINEPRPPSFPQANIGLGSKIHSVLAKGPSEKHLIDVPRDS